MTLEEQRAIVADALAGLKIYHALNTPEGKRPHYYYFGDDIVMPRDQYTPDLDDNKSLGQARGLKDKLRELGCSYTINWTEWIGFWEVVIVHDKYSGVEAISKLSEGAALLEAASKLAVELARRVK